MHWLPTACLFVFWPHGLGSHGSGGCVGRLSPGDFKIMVWVCHPHIKSIKQKLTSFEWISKIVNEAFANSLVIDDVTLSVDSTSICSKARILALLLAVTCQALGALWVNFAFWTAVGWSTQVSWPACAGRQALDWSASGIRSAWIVEARINWASLGGCGWN